MKADGIDGALIDSVIWSAVGEAEQQRRGDRPARAPPAEDQGGQGDEAGPEVMFFWNWPT